MATRDSGAIVVAPTGLEYAMARFAVRRYPVIRSGVGGFRHVQAETVVVCGLAGGLGELEAGSVVVAESVATETEGPLACDPDLVEAMVLAGKRLGISVGRVPMLTTDRLITGVERSVWAARGFAAAEMETFLWRRHYERTVAVRAILDTPTHPISEAWLRAGRAIPRPALRGELVWLAGRAPWFALRAARVAAAGLDMIQAL